MPKKPNQSRVDAIAQLQEAQQMIQEGRDELVAANKKIAKAQKLIDDSATILRGLRQTRQSEWRKKSR